MQNQAFERPNLSDMLADRIREMIIDGELTEDQRLNEVHLAAQLGVSRTPLREALARLASEETLVQVPRIGWFVRPLSAAEALELYPIRAILDPEALRVAGLPSSEQIAHLRALNRQLRATRTAEEVLRLDDQWHLALLAHCPNRVLVQLIEQFMLRTRRYEVVLMREAANVGQATDDHEVILTALERGDLDGGCAGLRANMQSGLPPILTWLEARDARRRSQKEV